MRACDIVTDLSQAVLVGRIVRGAVHEALQNVASLLKRAQGLGRIPGRVVEVSKPGVGRRQLALEFSAAGARFDELPQEVVAPLV